jgi:hypothetical protein
VKNDSGRRCRGAYADKNVRGRSFGPSGLDWVLVRPSVLYDKPGGRKVRAFTDLSGFHGVTISRQDVASFVLDQVQGGDWLNRSPLVTW